MRKSLVNSFIFRLVALGICLQGCVGAANESIYAPTHQGLMMLKDGGLSFLGELGQRSRVDHSLLSFRSNFMAACGERLIVAGQGKMAYFEQGQLHEAKHPPMDAVEHLLLSQGIYLALHGREMATSSDLQQWQLWDLPFSSASLGVATDGESCAMLNAEGQMVFSVDMKSWSRLDYNEYYDQEIRFCGIKNRGDLYYAFGQNQRSALPVVCVSRDLKTWQSRDIAIESLSLAQSLELNDVLWDGHQFLLLCNDGWLLTMPDCVKCDKARQIGQRDWRQSFLYQKKIYLIDEDDSFIVFKPEHQK